MARWVVGLTILGLGFCGLACHEAQPGVEPGAVLDQLAAREDAYHAVVGSLSTACAIRSETAAYAMDMHGLLDDLREACPDAMHAASMDGYTMGDLSLAMDRARVSIDDYTARVKSMEVIADMMEACNEHHAAMNETLKEMDGMLADVMPGAA